MAPTFIANAVTVILWGLQILHIQIAPADVQTTITVLGTIAIALFTLIRQVVTKRSTLVGTRPTN